MRVLTSTAHSVLVVLIPYLPCLQNYQNQNCHNCHQRMRTFPWGSVSYFGMPWSFSFPSNLGAVKNSDNSINRGSQLQAFRHVVKLKLRKLQRFRILNILGHDTKHLTPAESSSSSSQEVFPKLDMGIGSAFTHFWSLLWMSVVQHPKTFFMTATRWKPTQKSCCSPLITCMFPAWCKYSHYRQWWKDVQAHKQPL